VVTVLLGATPHGVELDEVERQALATLAEGGLVPPLRLVATAEDIAEHAAGHAAQRTSAAGQHPDEGLARDRRVRGGTGGISRRRPRHAAG
jgi:hypothetical protein